MKKYDNIYKDETISLSLAKDGYWLWDETRGMNLGMRANSEREAFLEAIHYYQKRLAKVESELREITTKVDAFVSQFTEED